MGVAVSGNSSCPPPLPPPACNFDTYAVNSIYDAEHDERSKRLVLIGDAFAISFTCYATDLNLTPTRKYASHFLATLFQRLGF